MKRFNDIKQHLTALLRDHAATVGIYAAAAATLAIILAAFTVITECPVSRPLFMAAVIAGDTVLLTAPYWLMPGRWRWTVTLPVVLTALFLLVNVWYYRFWGDILPLTAFSMMSNVNGLLLDSVRGLPEAADLWIVLPPMTLVVLVVALRRRLRGEPPLRMRVRVYATLCCVAVFILTQLAVSESARRWRTHELGDRVSLWQATVDRLGTVSFQGRVTYRDCGICVYMTRMAATALSSRDAMRELTDAERAEVDAFIAANIDESRVTTANRDKNVVFIIVESLNADVIGRKVAGHEVTPTLNALLTSEGTFAALDMRTQIRQGGSGDGQLIYNTGLMPLSDDVTSLTVVPRAHFAPLASMLGRHTAGAVFADDGRSWNQSVAFNRFGFDKVYTSEDNAGAVALRGADGAMFDRALEIIRTAPQPFMLEMVTISMHVPFDDAGVTGYGYFDNAGLTDNERGYLRMTAYFDAELARFIDGLKAIGVWDDTILVLASDHSQNIAVDASERAGDDTMPILFMAVNTGVTRTVEHTVYQTDVFPTLLDIAGVTGAPYRGVGVSMRRPGVRDAARIPAEDRISDLILRGDRLGAYMK